MTPNKSEKNDHGAIMLGYRNMLKPMDSSLFFQGTANIYIIMIGIIMIFQYSSSTHTVDSNKSEKYYNDFLAFCSLPIDLALLQK